MIGEVTLLGDAIVAGHAENLVRLAVAVVLGGLIGLEREFRDKPAGLRTMILICVGSCIFSIMSATVSGPNADRARIAAQIVTGVGFLGAGSIIRGENGVTGLTTAATIWAVSAIGISVGFGSYFLGCVGTGAILVTLAFLPYLERRVAGGYDVQDFHFAMGRADDVVPRVARLFIDAHLRVVSNDWYEEGDAIVFDITAHGKRTAHEMLRERMLRSHEYHLRKT